MSPEVRGKLVSPVTSQGRPCVNVTSTRRWGAVEWVSKPNYGSFNASPYRPRWSWRKAFLAEQKPAAAATAQGMQLGYRSLVLTHTPQCVLLLLLPFLSTSISLEQKQISSSPPPPSFPHYSALPMAVGTIVLPEPHGTQGGQAPQQLRQAQVCKRLAKARQGSQGRLPCR